MEKFEKYHPIMTQHFTFDWITKARLNRSTELMRLVKNQPTLTTAQAAELISQQMLKIMRNQELSWGIYQRPNHYLIGLTRLTNFNLADQSVELHFVLQSAVTTSALTELLTRLVTFVFAELNLREAVLVPTATTVIAPTILTNLGFSQSIDSNNWVIDRAVSLKTSL